MLSGASCDRLLVGLRGLVEAAVVVVRAAEQRPAVGVAGQALGRLIERAERRSVVALADRDLADQQLDLGARRHLGRGLLGLGERRVAVAAVELGLDQGEPCRGEAVVGLERVSVGAGRLLELAARLEDLADRDLHDRVVRIEEGALLRVGDRVAPALRVLGERRHAEDREALAELVVDLGRLLGRGDGVGDAAVLGDLRTRQARVGERRLGVELDRLLERLFGVGELPERNQRLAARLVRRGARRARGHRLVRRGERARPVLVTHESARQGRERGRGRRGRHGFVRDRHRVLGRPPAQREVRDGREHLALAGAARRAAGLVVGVLRLVQVADPLLEPAERDLSLGAAVGGRLAHGLHGLVRLALDDLVERLRPRLVELRLGERGDGEGKQCGQRRRGSLHSGLRRRLAMSLYPACL